MRHHLTITITDVHGSRQFTLTYLIRRFLLLIVWVLGLLILIGGVIVWQAWAERSLLEAQITDLYQQKEQVAAEYQQALAQQSERLSALNADHLALEDEVQAKDGQLTMLQETFHKLEAQLSGLSDGEEKRLASLSPADMTLLMQRIPSGTPSAYKLISDSFGWRTHPITKKRAFHDGMDFSCQLGTPVHATADGVVTMADWDGGYGLKVEIDHGYGFKTVYAHLSKALVSRGDVVAKGDDIALSGNTGGSTGAHLHYEVHFMNNKLNPKPFADWNQYRPSSIFKQVKEVPWESFADLVIQEKRLVLKQSLPTAVNSTDKSS